MLKKLLFIFPLVISTNAFAQESTEASDVEEVVVTGSQIKGAKITGALPVTVITSDDIEGIGVESGDELFAELASVCSKIELTIALLLSTDWFASLFPGIGKSLLGGIIRVLL